MIDIKSNNNDSLTIPLFPSVCLYSSIFNEIPQSELEFLHKTPSNQDSNNSQDFGWVSNDYYILDSPNLSVLSKWIKDQFLYYATQVMHYNIKDIALLQSWVSTKYKNESHSKHIHGNSFLSGVFFFDRNPEDNPIILHSNQEDFNPKTPPYIYIKQNIPASSPLASQVPYSPKPNELIIFPSTLAHSVSENQSNTPRKSLAINSFPKGEILGDLNDLNGLELKRIL